MQQFQGAQYQPPLWGADSQYATGTCSAYIAPIVIVHLISFVVL